MTRAAVWPAIAGVALAALAACDEPAPVDIATGTLVPTPALDWSPSTAGQVVVAKVNGRPITLRAIEELHADWPQLTSRELLQRLVELEVLAQQADREELTQREAPTQAWRQALVREYLHTQFEPTHEADAIHPEEVEWVYQKRWRTWDHFDLWKITELGINCCIPGSDVRPCDTQEALDCFATQAEVIERVYRDFEGRLRLFDKDPEAVAREVRAYYEEVKDRYPRLYLQEFERYYRPSLPHSEQKGYRDLMDEAVARAIVEAETGVLLPPVQSLYGYHVLLKRGHKAERHLRLHDEGVEQELRELYLPAWRKGTLVRHLKQLAQRHPVEAFPSALDMLAGPSSGTQPSTGGAGSSLEQK